MKSKAHLLWVLLAALAGVTLWRLSEMRHMIHGTEFVGDSG